MAAHSGLLFLTGAPVVHNLDWREEGLLNGFCSALNRYLDQDHAPSSTAAPTQSSMLMAMANWRSIPLNSRTFYESPAMKKKVLLPTALPTTGKEALLEPKVAIKEDFDFLEHSFAIHADLQSSQLAPQSGSEDFESTFITESSIMSTNSLDESVGFFAKPSTVESTQFPGLTPKSGPRGIAGPIMNVKSIPSSDYLLRLQPQTMTANLIVGIINVAPARTVRVRRGAGYEMEIIEVLVGDDTKAGFTISSWHTPRDSQPKNQDDLRKTLQTLRSQDVILVERIALSAFNGQVYGQSLNKRATKNTTAITVLHKAGQQLNGSADMESQSPSIRNKIQRVKDWADSFVGPRNKRSAVYGPSKIQNEAKRRKDVLTQEEFLPPDSQ